jgi:phosphohistidine phosphatase SixA
MSELDPASSENLPQQSGRSIVTIVRHTCAGDKEAWRGPDAERPLDEGGTRQAGALADTLGNASVHRLLASPTKRCIDTLVPLAARLQLDIEPAGAYALTCPPRNATLARSSTVRITSSVAGNVTAGNAISVSASARAPTVGHGGRSPAAGLSGSA